MSACGLYFPFQVFLLSYFVYVVGYTCTFIHIQIRKKDRILILSGENQTMNKWELLWKFMEGKKTRYFGAIIFTALSTLIGLISPLVPELLWTQ